MKTMDELINEIARLTIQNEMLKERLKDKPKCETCKWFVVRTYCDWGCTCAESPLTDTGPSFGCIYHEAKQ